MKLPDKFISKEAFEQKKVSNYQAIPIVKDTTCPNCGLSTLIQTHLNEKEPTLIGWCDTKAGFMGVFECPTCFEKFRYHISTTGRCDKEKFYEDFALHFYLQSTRK